MDDSGSGKQRHGRVLAEGGTAQQDADGGRPARQGLARYARPALIAGGVIAVVCVALLVIIFFLDSFNATVYSVGGKDVQDATDEATAIRENYAGGPRRRHRVPGPGRRPGRGRRPGAVPAPERGRSDDGDNGEDVDFEDLGGR